MGCLLLSALVMPNLFLLWGGKNQEGAADRADQETPGSDVPEPEPAEELRRRTAAAA